MSTEQPPSLWWGLLAWLGDIVDALALAGPVMALALLVWALELSDPFDLMG